MAGRVVACSCLLFLRASLVLGIRNSDEYLADSEANLTLGEQSGGAAALQAGALLLERFELISVLRRSSDWPSNFPGYEKKSFLGKGAFGETWLAFDKKRQQNVAVKFFYRKERSGKITLLNRGNAKPDEKAQLAEAGAECDTPTQIIGGKDSEAGKSRFSKCFENKVNDPKYAHLVLEVAGTESLEEYVARQKRKLGGGVVLRIAKMMVEGLVQMEGKYVHRDIKPANVMVYTDGEDGKLYLRYIDFGLVVKNNANDGVAGTPMFLPPEMWPIVPRTARMTPAFDVYSTGETLFSLICGKTFHEFIFDRFGGRGDSEIARQLKSRSPSQYCTPPSELRPLFEVVVSGMLPAAPGSRASPTALLAKPVFKGIQTLKVADEGKKPSRPTPSRPTPAKPTPAKPVIPVVEKPKEPTFLEKCHASKKFWFPNAVRCCLQERYDPARHAICERPCGPKVAYQGGMCERNCQTTSSGSYTFNQDLQCCVATIWKDKCIYRDIPGGEGWGWM